MTTLVSLMTHKDRLPNIYVETVNGGEVWINTTEGYGWAVENAIRRALELGYNLVLADTDGYHPVCEINELVERIDAVNPKSNVLIKPFRENIGSQSFVFEKMFSLRFGRFLDPSGGLYALSNSLLNILPECTSPDMTVHIEILKNIFKLRRTRIIEIDQYSYTAGLNDKFNSKRTKNYQYKLFKTLL